MKATLNPMFRTNLNLFIKKILAASLLSTSFIALAPNSASAISPVGAANPTITVNAGLGVATLNAAATSTALLVNTNTATQTARSVGLAAHNNDSQTAQTATVALGGVLSLYSLASTTVAFSATAGQFSATAVGASSGVAGTAPTSTATGIAFTVTGSTPTAFTVATLWTAPTTAGSYTLELYRATPPGTTASIPTSTAPTLGVQIGKITVTVGGSHPIVGGTNAPATLGGVNSSMFVAVASNPGVSAVVHSATDLLGDGEDEAKSKGLLAKDTSFGTAQSATVLGGAVLSLYANVSTTAAFTASGGKFSDSTGGPSTSPTATYSNDLRTTLLVGAVVDTRKTISTLWTAPTTAGNYTVSLYVGAGTGEPTTTVPAVSLAANITVTVVAASAGGAYFAPYSVCAAEVQSTNANQLGATGAGIDSTGTVKNGDSWSIDFDLNDAYGKDLDSGNIVVSATNGALVNLGTNATTPVAGTSSTDVDFGSPSLRTVRVSQGTADAPVTTTVTISYNGTSVCTKTVSIRGAVAKLTVANVGTQKLSESAGSAQWMYQSIDLYSAGMFTVLATDSAGNIVATDGLGTMAAVAATLTTTVQAMTFPTAASSPSSTSASRFTLGSFQCGGVAGTSSVKVQFTTTATGKTVTSDAFNARCADVPYTYKVSLDKAAYTQGEIATATVQFTDSKGNPANNVTAIGASSWVLPFMTGVTFTMPTGASSTAVTKADGSIAYVFTVGASDVAVTAGTYTGVVSYDSPAGGEKSTPTYKISTGSSDVTFTEVLKSVVALIASINKQIQALQKLILNRKR